MSSNRPGTSPEVLGTATAAAAMCGPPLARMRPMNRRSNGGARQPSPAHFCSIGLLPVWVFGPCPFYVSVDPLDHVCCHIPPVRCSIGDVTLTEVLPIFDRLPKPPQADKNLVSRKRRHRRVPCPVHHQEGRFDAIKIEDRRVFDVPLAIFP